MTPFPLPAAALPRSRVPIFLPTAPKLSFLPPHVNSVAPWRPAITYQVPFQIVRLLDLSVRDRLAFNQLILYWDRFRIDSVVVQPTRAPPPPRLCTCHSIIAMNPIPILQSPNSGRDVSLDSQSLRVELGWVGRKKTVLPYNEMVLQQRVDIAPIPHSHTPPPRSSRFLVRDVRERQRSIVRRPELAPASPAHSPARSLSWGAIHSFSSSSLPHHHPPPSPPPVHCASIYLERGALRSAAISASHHIASGPSPILLISSSPSLVLLTLSSTICLLHSTNH